MTHIKIDENIYNSFLNTFLLSYLHSIIHSCNIQGCFIILLVFCYDKIDFRAWREFFSEIADC